MPLPRLSAVPVTRRRIPPDYILITDAIDVVGRHHFKDMWCGLERIARKIAWGLPAEEIARRRRYNEARDCLLGELSQEHLPYFVLTDDGDIVEAHGKFWKAKGAASFLDLQDFPGRWRRAGYGEFPRKERVFVRYGGALPTLEGYAVIRRADLATCLHASLPDNTTSPPVMDKISLRPEKPHSGPAEAKARRSASFESADRTHFPVIEEMLISGKARSPYGAALQLAQKGMLAGSGTPESKAKRVSSLYLKAPGVH